jgi:NodT family efflux transporter outer membrane factor (OMF) lipoprotein
MLDFRVVHRRCAARSGSFAIAVTLAAALALDGCAVAPPLSPPSPGFAIPNAWSVAMDGKSAHAASTAPWWLRFDDPLLVSLVTRALQANTGVRGAQAALRQARALREVAAAALLPVVGGSMSAQHSTAGRDNSSNNFKAGLDANWDLDLFGASRSALAANDAYVRASDATLEGVEASIASEVGLSYITLRTAQTRLAIAEENLASQQETLQITRWRLQAGLVSSLDLEQARAATEQTRALLPAFQIGIAQAGHAIAVLTGQPPADLTAALATAAQIPHAADDSIVTDPAAMLEQRPDVRAAEYQVRAAAARVTEADARRAPSVNVGGALGVAALTLGSLTSGASIVTALLASVSVPVFDGGAGVARVRAQVAAWDAAQTAYQATVLTALREVEDALAALQGDRERLLRLRVAADAAAGAAAMARQRYSSGLIDFQIVLQTQRTQLVTQDGVARAEGDVSADQVYLFKALGRNWPSDAYHALPDTQMPSAATFTWNPLP